MNIHGGYCRDFIIFVRTFLLTYEIERHLHNLDCHYCYYLDKAVQYGGRQAVMSDELLELYVKQYICANEVDTVQFCWHGGEPLLLGVDFYRRAMEFQRK